MTKKKEYQTNNFLTFIGHPAFSLLIFLISIFGFFLILLERLLSFKFTAPRFPVIHLNFPKIKIPPFPRQTPHLNTGSRRIFFAFSLILLCFLVYYEIFWNLPSPNTLTNFPSKLTTRILDRNGVLLYKIYKDENRTLVNLSNLPEHVKNAFLAAEDKDFYFHNGFSLPGIIRAIYKDLFDDKLEGGSTITQQLIKNTILTPEKTITRKIKELVLAIQTERLFTKNQIFEMYLNQVGFGGTAYGIQEASRQYFDVDAVDLSLAQSAYLAGLTRAPSKYSPFGDHPELALSRQQRVLNLMHQGNLISEDDLKKALSQKLTFKSARIEIKAPHFVMLVKDLLIDQLGETAVTQGGLVVYTTLDSVLQDSVQKIVTNEVKSLIKLNVTNGSALVTNPQTGEILAMVGSTDYFNLNQNGQVNLTTSLRQPGSAIKPLNYALFLESGHSPSTIIDDKPISIRLSGQETWTPRNYDGRFHGPVSLRQALASSYNIPSILLLLQNGTDKFADFAQKAGITSWTDPGRFGPSMALGSLEIRMVDLATAYSTFANGGTTTPLRTVLKIEKNSNTNIHLVSCPNKIDNIAADATANAQENSCSSRKTVSPTTAYLITDILSDNSARSPAFGTNSILNIKSAKVAVKTGTSNDLKDNWTIGYTKDYLVATWVGNNDSSPMSHIASGITGASPIWAKIFNQILEDNPQAGEIPLPENLIPVRICTLTGTLTCAGCPSRIEYFTRGTEPQTACDPADIARRLNPTPINSP